jgi:hypothetical protein
MKVMKEGQCLKHALYGIGIATASNEERTTIDFYEHGRKMFVTQLLEAELVAEAPPRAPKPRAPKAAKKSGGAK